MSLNAHPFARYRRMALALASTAVAAVPVGAFAQALNPSFTAGAPQAAQEPTGAVIQRIVVRGTQRIEPATVDILHVGARGPGL